MPFEIHRTTAEHVIGATDATLQNPNGVDAAFVAQFLDITNTNANNALLMGEQLKILAKDTSNRFKSILPVSAYLVTCRRIQKAVIFRFLLEQYPPYKTFKIRLALDELAPQAANQARAIHQIRAHRDDILSTFISFGTYANSLISEGAGLYRPIEDEEEDFFRIVNEVVQSRENTELFIRRKLGSEATEWINPQNVLFHLITAYQRLICVDEDQRAPIVHAGNAIESFLSQLAVHHHVNVQNAHGINAKTDLLARSNHIVGKHKFMLKYLGHLRNAADHGNDPEIQQTWEISRGAAISYVYVALLVITDLVAHLNGRFVI